MSVTTTPNFGLNKLDRFDDWLTEINANWDNLDILLKDITLTVGVDGVMVIADNTTFAHKATNLGTGFDYQSLGISEFNDVDITRFNQATALILALNATAGTGFEMTMQFVAGRWIFSTTEPLDIVASEVTLQGNKFDVAGIDSTIQSQLNNLSLQGNTGVGDYVEIKPESGNDEFVRFKRPGNTGVRLEAFGNGVLGSLFLNIADTFIDSLGKLNVETITSEAVSGSPTLELRSGSGTIELFTGSGTGLILFGDQPGKFVRFSANVGSPESFRFAPENLNLAEYIQMLRVDATGIKISGFGAGVLDRLYIQTSNLYFNSSGFMVTKVAQEMRFIPDDAGVGDYFRIARSAGTGVTLTSVGTSVNVLTIGTRLRLADQIDFAIAETSTTPFTITTESAVFMDATAGVKTVKLPPLRSGLLIFIKKFDTSGNVVTVDGNGSNIDGSATDSITTSRGHMILMGGSVEWSIFQKV